MYGAIDVEAVDVPGPVDVIDSEEEEVTTNTDIDDQTVLAGPADPRRSADSGEPPHPLRRPADGRPLPPDLRRGDQHP